MIPLGLDRAASSAEATAFSRRSAGRLLIAFAVAMNVPFAVLAARFDYPSVLRLDAATVLQRAHAGGGGLLATWYAYALVAAAFVPLALCVQSALGGRLRGSRGLALLGVLAGVFQTLGLLRWVFVVPQLAAAQAMAAADGARRTAVIAVFEGLHQFLGVAVGEHLGQVCTALWTVAVARALRAERRRPRWLPGLGFGVGALLLVGQAEAFATVLPIALGPLAAAIPLGFVGWSLWLLALGLWWLRAPTPSSVAGEVWHPSSA
jgi:hypothetical protein